MINLIEFEVKVLEHKSRVEKVSKEARNMEKKASQEKQNYYQKHTALFFGANTTISARNHFVR